MHQSERQFCESRISRRTQPAQFKMAVRAISLGIVVFCLQFAIKSGFSLPLMGPNNTKLQLASQNSISITFPVQTPSCFDKSAFGLISKCHLSNQAACPALLLVNIICNNMSAKKVIASNIDSFGKHYSERNMSQGKIIVPKIGFAKNS